MTPLAHQITKDFIVHGRPGFKDHASALEIMRGDVHFFEVTEVMPLAEQLGFQMQTAGFADGALFLPAPLTWIEFYAPEDGRSAYLLKEHCEDGVPIGATVRLIRGGGSVLAGFINFKNPFARGAMFVGRKDDTVPDRADGVTTLLLYAYLCLINTPKIIGRKQHMPHRGLERDLLKGRKPIGMFPLRGWTEVKLSATIDPQYKEIDGIAEASLTGSKCLHYCRAHLRIRNGRLEHVRAHWRGDASLGTKNTRYKVVPAANTISLRT